MFSELIYTRCRQGIDILKDGRAISSDGFKVYSCSNNILTEDIVDLPLLFNAAQGKQTYNDPAFMDDAYLYFTPDKGRKMMVDFHPIPFDKGATGDYSHRPGNFINQVFIGEFQQFYPYELFGSSYAWDAKERGEAYYYNTSPSPLPMRESIDGVVGSIVLDDIAEFVADGRKDAVSGAVSFLIAQFALPPENRKFLVIQDENTSKIELWIAAIESAFSPRMASGLSFATRLDKFVTTNKYTINLNGQYQSQMNLQDPKQKLRYRAMIVGVDERDRNNTASVRPLANSPYVILNGKTKAFMGESAPSHPYYAAITIFDERQDKFCRGFLQMLDICAPSEDMTNLYTAFLALSNISEKSEARAIASSLSLIQKYGLKTNAYLVSLYGAIKNNLHRFLQEDLSCAFGILNWLQKAATVVGDAEATMSFNKIICKAFADGLFSDPTHRDSVAFWKNIQGSSFYDAVASFIVRDDVLDYYDGELKKFTCDSWISFLPVYLTCARKANLCTAEKIQPLMDRGLHESYRTKDTGAAAQLCSLISKYSQADVRSLLLGISCGADDAYSRFVMNVLLHADRNLTATDASTLAFCKKLVDQKMGDLCGATLIYRANLLNNNMDIERFLNTLLGDQQLAKYTSADVYMTLDSKILIADKGSTKIAVLLQEQKPEGISCVKAAHVCAYAAIDNKKRPVPISKVLKGYVNQGFPSIEDETYAKKLVEKILSCNFDGEDLSYIIEILSRSEFYGKLLVREILDGTTAKRNYEWNMLLYVVEKLNDKSLFDVVVSECADLKQPEKQLAHLEKMITEFSLRKCFAKISAAVHEKVQKDTPQSKFGKFFGFMSNDSKNKWPK